MERPERNATGCANCAGGCNGGCHNVVTLRPPQKKTYDNHTGDGQMQIYHVFPGIDLIYNDVHMDCCALGTVQQGDWIEIHHCREGRIEQELGGEFFYLMPGDLSVMVRQSPAGEYQFPLRHYHGITIAIDLKVAPKCFSCILEDVNVQPAAVAEKLCGSRGCFILRNDGAVEHIFSELYAIAESIRRGYLKLKVLELLLVLSTMEPEADVTAQKTLPESQVRLAKDVAAVLGESMDRHITIAELADRFYVSQSQLKRAFKGVYGVPVFSYMRIQKMQAAALKLIHTDRPILEIASAYGYDNGSKFASAFREIMGETPGEYRRVHGKT